MYSTYIIYTYMTQVRVWSTLLLLYWWRDNMPRLQSIYSYIYISIIKRKNYSMCLSGLKKTYLLKLDLILFSIVMTQVKVNLSSTLFLFLLVLIFHYVHTWKKLLVVVSHNMNRTSTCRSHCRMTSIMFKFRQTDSRQKKRERDWTS